MTKFSIRKPVSALARFSKARDGVAAVEFALLAPLLVTMMLGSIEITHSLWASGKLNQATDSVNDLISRTANLDTGSFNNLLAAAPLILKPYPQNDLKMIVTSAIGCLQDATDPDSDMTYYVLWSKGWKNGATIASPHAVDSLFSKQPDSLKLADGETLIVTEGTYTYEPRIARKIGSEIPMDSIAYNQPRETDRVRYPSAQGPIEKTCDDYRGGA